MKKNRKLKILQSLVIAAMVITIAACEKTNTTSKHNYDVSNIVFTDCIHHQVSGNQKGDQSQDSVSVDYHDGTIHITHYNLTVNCGFEKIDVVVEAKADTIRIIENGIPENADCMCEVENSFDINNVPHGTYTIIMENWDSIPYVQTYNF